MLSYDLNMVNNGSVNILSTFPVILVDRLCFLAKTPEATSTSLCSLKSKMADVSVSCHELGVGVRDVRQGC